MHMKSIIFLLFTSIILFVGCTKDGIETTGFNGLSLGNFNYEFNDDVPHFVDFAQQSNFTLTNNKAKLGRVLFYDKTLSVNNNTSCGSCHIQELGFGDGKALSKGFINENTEKHSMTIVNAMGQFSYFWNGRAWDLKTQVLMPIANHIEMGIENEELLLAKIQSQDYYKPLFEDAFNDNEINIENVGEALASFVGSIASYNTKYDKVQKGLASYTAQEEKGFELFNTKYQCNQCHGGDNFNESWSFGFGGGNFANIGLNAEDKDAMGQPDISSGGRNKVPNLRNIMVTGPYMHDGRFNTIEQVLEHYASGINVSNPNTDWRLTNMIEEGNGGLNITAEDKRALIAFLHTLTDETILTHPKYSNPF